MCSAVETATGFAGVGAAIASTEGGDEDVVFGSGGGDLLHGDSANDRFGGRGDDDLRGDGGRDRAMGVAATGIRASPAR